MPKSLIQLVAANVKAARAAKGWTRADLARASHVAENTVKNIEEPEQRAPNARGSASPRLDNLDKLANAMGYPTWQLLAENFNPADPLARQPVSERERVVYSQIRRAYQQLDRSQFDGNDHT